MKKLIYWGSIAISIILVFSINLIFNFSWQTFLYCLLALAMVILPCIVYVTIIEFLPQKLFNPQKRIFKTSKWETKFYEKIGIKKWKENIPVIKSVHSKFDKTQIADPKNAEYLYLFLTENCKAGLGHGVSMLWGYLSVFVLMFILPITFIFSAWLPVAIVSGFVHFLSFAIQRYLRPRLFKLYTITKAKEEVEKSKLINQSVQFDGEIETAPQN